MIRKARATLTDRRHLVDPTIREAPRVLLPLLCAPRCDPLLTTGAPQRLLQQSRGSAALAISAVSWPRIGLPVRPHV
jgi:hypothetical protein